VEDPLILLSQNPDTDKPTLEPNLRVYQVAEQFLQQYHSEERILPLAIYLGLEHAFLG